MLEESEKEEYLKYVQDKIKYVEQYMDIIKNYEITPQVINHALSNHGKIMNWLISEFEKISLDYEDLKEDYQVEFDKWVIEARKKLNDGRVASKFASNSEIEGCARVEHREEYLRWKRKLLIMEHKVSFYRRIRDNWQNQKDILTNLSWNTRTEMKNLNTEDYTNNVYQKKVIKKILKTPLSSNE